MSRDKSRPKFAYDSPQAILDRHLAGETQCLADAVREYVFRQVKANSAYDRPYFETLRTIARKFSCSTDAVEVAMRRDKVVIRDGKEGDERRPWIVCTSPEKRARIMASYKPMPRALGKANGAAKRAEARRGGALGAPPGGKTTPVDLTGTPAVLTGEIPPANARQIDGHIQSITPHTPPGENKSEETLRAPLGVSDGVSERTTRRTPSDNGAPAGSLDAKSPKSEACQGCAPAAMPEPARLLVEALSDDPRPSKDAVRQAVADHGVHLVAARLRGFAGARNNRLFPEHGLQVMLGIVEGLTFGDARRAYQASWGSRPWRTLDEHPRDARRLLDALADRLEPMVVEGIVRTAPAYDPANLDTLRALESMAASQEVDE